MSKSKTTICACTQSARRGAALVETALVVNLFLLFVFVIMEFGHFVMVKQLLENAAREGAQLAAVSTTAVTTQQVVSKVTSCLAGQSLTDLDIQVFQANPQTGAYVDTWTNASFGQPVAVKITGSYQPMIPLAALLHDPIPLTVEAMSYSESN